MPLDKICANHVSKAKHMCIYPQRDCFTVQIKLRMLALVNQRTLLDAVVIRAKHANSAYLRSVPADLCWFKQQTRVSYHKVVICKNIQSCVQTMVVASYLQKAERGHLSAYTRKKFIFGH